MDERSKRIEEAIQKSGFSYVELEKITGISKSALQRYASGKTKKIPVDCIEKIASATNVSSKYLMGWEDEKPQDDLSTLMQKYNNIYPIKLKRFPLLGKIACGEPIYAEEDHESFISANAEIRADFCLRASGNSMINAEIYDGDIVFIRKQPVVDNGEIAAVIIDNEATLKRVYFDKENERLQIVAENPAYAPLVYIGQELEYVRILGKAVALMRNI